MNATLFDDNLEPLWDLRARRTIDARFREFHAANPDVFTTLVALAREARAKGFKRYGVKSLFEVVRWHRALKDGPREDSFKLNNVFTSRYARLLMDTYPDEFAGFFELRELRAE
jgi:hypothetical protein